MILFLHLKSFDEGAVTINGHCVGLFSCLIFRDQCCVVMFGFGFHSMTSCLSYLVYSCSVQNDNEVASWSRR